MLGARQHVATGFTASDHMTVWTGSVISSFEVALCLVSMPPGCKNWSIALSRAQLLTWHCSAITMIESIVVSLRSTDG